MSESRMVTPDWISVKNAPYCRYNMAVDCEEKENCAKCGWNPANEDLRKRRAREVLEAREEWVGE